MNTGKKTKPQTPKASATPKPALKTPKPSVAPTPAIEPKAATTPAVTTNKTAAATPTSPSPALKSILKKPKPVSETPAKISAQPATTASAKQTSSKKAKTLTPAVSIAPSQQQQSQKKPSPKSTLKGAASPHPTKAQTKGSPFPQSNGSTKNQKSASQVSKLPKFDEEDSEDDEDDDIDVGAFDLGSDDDEDGPEDFSVQAQIAKALGTKKAPASAKKGATTPAAQKKAASPATATKGRAASKTAIPELSDDDEEEDSDDAAPPTQAKNWKALASKTLTGKEPITNPQPKDTGAAAAPSSSKKRGVEQIIAPTPKQAPKDQKKTTPNTTDAKKAAPQSGKKAKVEEQKSAAGKKEEKKSPAQPKKVQMFESDDEEADFDDEGDEGDEFDESALDFDGAEGEEGDDAEQEATIMRALAKKGDFTDLGRSKGPHFGDDDEGDEGDEGDDGESSEDFENDDLPIEKAAKRLEKMQQRVEREAQAELQTNMQEVQTFKLPSGQEIEQEKLVAPDLTLLNQRIQDVLFTLADFRKKKEPERSRQEYMERLAQDLTTYYGYLPELIDRFLEMFSPAEAVEFLMANEAQRPVTLRINSLKTRRSDLIQTLSKRGIHVEPLADWTKVGCKVTMSKLPLGATPEYMAGHYVLQSAASFLPVMALAPQEHERVLDMCASPGGKATYIAALMKNTGMLVANDANTKRLPSLTGNIHRLGVRNSIVTNFDGRKLKKHFGLFDRILLDAPCSGLGVISKDPSVKTTKTNKDIQRCAHIQKELALAAIDMLDADSKTGGYLVYSTCSISVEENEEVVDYILSHRHVKLVETNIPFGVVGMTRFRTKQFHPSLSLTRRFYPHVHNMDGFFVSKFKKLSDGAKTVAAAPATEEESSAVAMDTEEEEQTQKQTKTKPEAVTTSSAPKFDLSTSKTRAPSVPPPKDNSKKASKKKNKKNNTSAPVSSLPTPQVNSSPAQTVGVKRKKDKGGAQSAAQSAPQAEQKQPVQAVSEEKKSAGDNKKQKVPPTAAQSPKAGNGVVGGGKSPKGKKQKVAPVTTIAPSPKSSAPPVASPNQAKLSKKKAKVVKG